MKQGIIAFLLLWGGVAEAATSVIQINTHADGFIAPAINAALGPGHVDTDIFVDTTGGSSNTILSISAMMLSTTNTYQSVATGTPVNHGPYPVAGFSSCSWNPTSEFQTYASFASHNQMLVWAYGAMSPPIGCGAQPVGTAPGTIIATASSANSFNGGTAPGIEFEFSANYLGLDTSADSWVTAEMAGFIIAMQFQHPTWNLFDIKAAFRQTAANWSTGYNASNFGYGVISYSAATAVSAPSALFLQPPGVFVQNNVYYATITLLPFRQARRDHEVIYSFAPGATFPLKNEYTLADITSAGGSLIYTGNNTDIMPQLVYAPAASGTLTFAAFTTDGSGNYSRAEPFSKQSITLTINGACAH